MAMNTHLKAVKLTLKNKVSTCVEESSRSRARMCLPSRPSAASLAALLLPSI